MSADRRPDPSARPAGPRAEARARTMARIVELGNAQLIEHGAAELSVREIARGLGMVSSGIYRYVASRDELLTLLIVDAYGDLADAVDAALEQDRASPRERFLDLSGAMVRWALANPERWTLLYGTPVRGYDAPADATNRAGTRVVARVLEIAGSAGAEPASGPGLPLDPEVEALIASVLEEFDVHADASTGIRAVTAWSSLIGVISAHLFRQLGPDAAAHGEQLLAVQCHDLADLVAPR